MGWREEVDTALRSWLAAEGGGATEPSWRRIGTAVRGTASGTFEVDVRGSMLSGDHLQAESLRLAEPDRASISDGNHVMEVSYDGSTVRVRVAEFADPVDPTLWLLQQPPTFLIDTLIKGIAGITDERLAGRLARGQLGGELATVGLSSGTLMPSQDMAYRACRGHGLWMVWGPPGTGKTSVIMRAVVDLIADGKRVLLVSATNIAVDNVVVQVAKQTRDRPGSVVRVGTPHLREVADNPDVCLPLMVRARLTELDQQRDEIAKDLAKVRERIARLVELDSALVGFDEPKFARAERRLADASNSVETLSDRRSSVADQQDVAHSALTSMSHRITQAEESVRSCASDREGWHAIDALEFEAEDLESKKTRAEAVVAISAVELADAERVLTDLEDRSRWERLTDPGKSGKARRTRDHLASKLKFDRDRRDEAVEILDRRIKDVKRDISRRGHQITLSRDDIDRIDSEYRGALDEKSRLQDEIRRCAAESARLDRELARTAEAVDEVHSARTKRQPLLHAEASALRLIGADDPEREPELRKRHQTLQEQYEALAKDAQGAIIREARVVASTLAKFRTIPAMMEGPYDLVVVDEVGAASLPEVLLVVAAAQRNAVLLGDFMQLGPVGAQVLKGSRRTDIQRWLLTEVFDHCGIDSAASAQSNAGCIALDVQHRFGLDVMYLANSIAYDGTLKAGPTIEARARATQPGDAEIVLIDTDGLGDLGHVYRTGPSSGWWPAGMLLSRALADLHANDGSTVGVVTPYALQAEATLEAMRQVESDHPMLAEVGTAHRFQGREFGVVVFDLVESEDGPGMWMAKASRGREANGWSRSGLRLFNVAVTRVQQRVYIIGSRHRVENAVKDSALGALNKMLTDRRVRTIAASELIAPLGTGRPLGPVGGRLAEILSRHVEISDIQDEVEFYKTFGDRLSRARKSIWIWAPWVAKRLHSLLPVLIEAAARGVRIVVFVRDPGDQLQQRLEEFVDELSAVVRTVVRVNVMHQKIVVVDEQTVMIGSLNPLSQSHTREIMLTMRGTHFAKKILEGQHAEIFARPPRCGGCNEQDVDLKRRRDQTWYWRCRNSQCPERKGNRGWTQDIILGTARSGAS
ncbi:AAA domain-containing protein [Nocardia sp. NPDC058705]|uniref:AAA domain-containing protein n=1 Tax=Nocardia sp. NPDC058705 TaxID=3346609 RepID=UPI0036B9B174